MAGADLSRQLDALFINAPIRDYSLRPRVNDFTLPVLGMGYIATCAAHRDLNVGVIDAEALGLGVDETAALIIGLSPRWAGFNLLAPTYEISARIAGGLDRVINVMVGGHQAKAMPIETLTDPRCARIEALVFGDGETRVDQPDSNALFQPPEDQPHPAHPPPDAASRTPTGTSAPFMDDPQLFPLKIDQQKRQPRLASSIGLASP